MTYSQKANPNATNSELDAKIIKPFVQLTSEQRNELIQQFVELQVDNMDTQTLVEFVTDLLIDDYSEFNDVELKERITCFDDDDGLYDELVDNIVSDDEEKEIERLMEDTTDDIIVIDSPNSPLFP